MDKLRISEVLEVLNIRLGMPKLFANSFGTYVLGSLTVPKLIRDHSLLSTSYQSNSRV